MAVTQIVPRLYIGLSSDEKPTTGVVEGAEFVEVDADQRWIWDGSDWYQVDRVGIDWAHKMAHRGLSYHVGYGTPDASPLADDASLELWMSVPADVYPHLVLRFWSEEIAQVYVYENPTVSDEGTELSPVNRNRNSSNVTTVSIKHTPTVTDAGTALVNGRWIKGAVCPEDRGDREIDCKPGYTYLFRVTARASTVRAAIELDWYEFEAA